MASVADGSRGAEGLAVGRDRGTALVEARGICKRFGDVQANSGVDLALRAGEIHAILGENGAGKSVLAKTLYGIHTPDAGTVLVDGAEVCIDTPARARELGIGLLFQEFRLVPALSVLQNVALALPGSGVRLRRAEVAARIAAASRRYGMTLDPSARVRDLSVGQRQQVEIIKLLLSGARIMLMDEPTSVLAPQEVDALGSSLRELRDEGYAIALITHRLADVRALADRVTVLRGGVVRATFDDVDATADEALIDAVIGRELPVPRARRAPPDTRRLALRAGEIEVDDDRGRPVLRGVSLTVAAGEVVGVAGISGSGQRELAEAVLGLRRIRAGAIEILGHDIVAGGARSALEAGAVGISEDPLETDVVPGFTIAKHLALSRLDAPRRGMGYDWQALERQVARLPEASALALAAGSRAVTELSGGNVQRTMLVRALAGDPRLIVAEYPTRGLDIATAVVAQELLLERAARGAGVLLISEELDELFLLSDRIVVLHAGRVVACLAPAATTRQAVGSLMLGNAV